MVIKEYDFVTGVVREHHSHVCVGGPLAGKRYLAKSERGFRAAVRPKTTLTVPLSDKITTIATVDYKRDSFHTTDGDISFWVPNDQTPLQTMTILLDNYETCHKDSHKDKQR